MSEPGPNWINPFTEFLTNAHVELRKTARQHDVFTDKKLLKSFVQISEQRKFVWDIVDRVEALAATFDRLRELLHLWVQSDRKTWKVVDEQRAADPERSSFDDPPEECLKRRQYENEARALVAFGYYEMSTITGLWGAQFKPQPKSRLEYLVGVRNKILVHARRNALIKNSSCRLVIGPILYACLVGADSWVPLIRDYYIQELKEALAQCQEVLGTDDEEVAKNEALIRSDTLVEELDRIQRLRLKSYIIEEPDFLGSAAELAVLLQNKLIPEIKHACRPAVPEK